jgi:ribose transport system substrate-binding protein
MFIGFLTPDWRCGKDILMKRLNGVLGQVCFGLTKVEIWSCSILIAAMLALAIANDVRAGENTFIVGFPEDNMANDWRAAQVRELASELAKHSNIRFLQSDAGGQISRNLQDIEDMVDAGAKLLFLGPRDSKLLTPVVKKLHGQGIHIVLLTRRIESNDFDSYISPNDFNIARAAGAYLGKHLGGKGRVLMLEGVPSATTAIQRSAGFRKALEDFPDMRVVTVKTGNYSRTGGLSATESALKDGIVFDAIFSHNDAMAAGSRLALRAAGIDPRSVPTIGIDYLQETRDAIRKGEQLASFTYPTCGKEGARVAVDILNGKTVPKYIEVPSQIVTRENVESVSPIF